MNYKALLTSAGEGAARMGVFANEKQILRVRYSLPVSVPARPNTNEFNALIEISYGMARATFW